MSISRKKILVVLVGPTAVGKTALSIKLAQYFNAEIFSADSRQFYKELKIGVASPVEKELSVVKHHFIGHLSVVDYYNAYQYENAVMDKLEHYFDSHTVAFLVGGSGLYIDAVCKGIDLLPDPDPALRETLKKEWQESGLKYMQEKLKELDPEYFTKVDIQNPNRILRALEVCLTTGRPFSQQRTMTVRQRPFEILKIGLSLPREILVDRIHLRVEQMLKDGLIDEVKGLMQFREYNSLNTVGYKEIFKYLEGTWPIETAIEKIKINTRRYAKRQMTWFRKDTEILWFTPDQLKGIIQKINSNL